MLCRRELAEAQAAHESRQQGLTVRVEAAEAEAASQAESAQASAAALDAANAAVEQLRAELAAMVDTHATALAEAKSSLAAAHEQSEVASEASAARLERERAAAEAAEAAAGAEVASLKQQLQQTVDASVKPNPSLRLMIRSEAVKLRRLSDRRNRSWRTRPRRRCRFSPRWRRRMPLR